MLTFSVRPLLSFSPSFCRFSSQRDFVLKRLSEMPDLVTAVPQGAFYVFPDVSAHFGKSAPDGTVIGGATDLCLYLLRRVAPSVLIALVVFVLAARTRCCNPTESRL